MKWSELLKSLDDARALIRTLHGKELNKEIPEGDELAEHVQEGISFIPKQELDSLFACAPEPEPAPPARVPVPEHKIKEVVNRDEGRMIVMNRDEPFVPKEPVLDEVTEDELGK